MQGTYIIYGTELIDPIIEYYMIGRNLVNGQSIADINVTDGINSVPLTYEVADEPTTWTLSDVAVWVENYLQQYKV